jgi:anti-anti-sigma factor
MAQDRTPTLSRMTRESGVVVIHLSGDLDAPGTRQIEPALSVVLADRSVQAVIDVSAVSFLSSAALAMLASNAQIMRRGGGKLALAGASGAVSDVIVQSGFGDMLPSYPSLDDALSALEPGS